MAARFYAISRDEIHEFLTNLGFQSLTLKGVVELVYGKIVRVGNHRLSLRIYSAVKPALLSTAQPFTLTNSSLLLLIITGCFAMLKPLIDSMKYEVLVLTN